MVAGAPIMGSARTVTMATGSVAAMRASMARRARTVNRGVTASTAPQSAHVNTGNVAMVCLEVASVSATKVGKEHRAQLKSRTMPAVDPVTRTPIV